MTATRFQSVDALRGFDMFWIIGADYVVHALAAATGADGLAAISAQLRHAEWAGVRAYDLVFPLFMFLAGVSLGIVTVRDAGRASRREKLARALRRAVTLGALGVVYNWGWNVDFSATRFASVLGLIGGSFLIAAAVTTVTTSSHLQALAAATVLVVIAALHFLAPVPGFGPGVLTPEGSINGWIDRTFLPGRLHGGAYDPEGLLGVVSGASITLAGAVVGAQLARRSAAGEPFGLRWIALAGVLAIAAGILLSPIYPPVKKLWTATFDLIAIGASLLLLAGAVLTIDVWRFERIGRAFAVIGANAILAYFMARYFVYPVYKIAAAQGWAPTLSAVVISGLVALQWALLAALFRRRIFLRV